MILRKIITASILIFCLSACEGSNAVTASEVVVTDHLRGCFNGAHEVTSYTGQGSNYIAKGGKTVSADEMKALVRAVIGSESARTFDHAALGITEETVRENKKRIEHAVLREAYKEISREALARNKDVFEYPSIIKEAERRLTIHDNSTTHMELTVVIDDPHLSNERIELASAHQCPYMLPWQVRVGNRTWQTYCTDVPLKLAGIANKSGPCAPLLDGRKYWKCEFWNDDMFWCSSNAMHVLTVDTVSILLEKLPGYAKWGHQFRIWNAGVYHESNKTSHLGTILLSPGSRVIDQVDWDNDLKNGIPQTNWEQLAECLDKLEATVKKHKWLLEWKASNPKNGFKVKIFGAKTQLDKDELRAWNKAKLRGSPTVEVLLCRDMYWRGSVYLSDSESRSIVETEAWDKPGPHWLKREPTSFGYESPIYTVVDSYGKPQKRSLKKYSR